MTRVLTLRGRDLGEHGAISCGRVKKVIYSSSVVSYNPIGDTPNKDETVSVMVSHAEDERVIRSGVVIDTGTGYQLLTKFIRYTYTSRPNRKIVNRFYMQDRDSRLFNCCRPFDEEHMIEEAHPHTWNEQLQEQFVGSKLRMRVSARKVWRCEDVREVLVKRLQNTGRRWYYSVLIMMNPDILMTELRQLMMRLSFMDAIHGPWG